MMEAAAATITARTSRLTAEGVGARVIRGPDWKWGKQVSLNLEIAYNFFNSFEIVKIYF